MKVKVKKKLGGGLKIVLIFFVFFFILSKETISSQILDYETEEFLNEILKNVTTINKVNRKIKIKINDSDEINAFVDNQNTIHINSGLIEYSEDYVALLSVLAHEVGHIDLNHLALRKKIIKNKNKYNNLTLLSVIAGSAVTQNPELLQTTMISSAAFSNQYINFSKEQESEADLYALKTLNLLNTNSDSVIKLLKTIEKKLLQKGFSKEKQRVSTHPYLEDRILLIENYKFNKKYNIDSNYNHRFNFIRAKFLGYNNNIEMINKLDEPYKTYAESISYAKNGNLKMSLESLNKIIKNNYENNFLFETKADILFSFGFTNEAIKFYGKNLEDYPLNFYAQIRIFENIETKNLSEYEIKVIFDNNKELLLKYFNNKNILVKYINLAKQLNKNDWIEFLDFVLNINQFSKENSQNNIKIFKKTKDKDLLKLILIFEKTIS